MRNSPDDITQWDEARPLDDPNVYSVAPRSVVVLWRHLEPET
jgi:hypothetical protein